MLIRRISSFGIVVLCLTIWAALISCKPAKKASAPARIASIAAPLGVAPDLDTRLAKFKAIEMPLNRGALSPKEVQLVQKLVDAANSIESIYWRQSDPDGLKLYGELEKSADPLDQKVLRFLKINGSRYDLIDELKPFIGTQPAPPGHHLLGRGRPLCFLPDSSPLECCSADHVRVARWGWGCIRGRTRRPRSFALPVGLENLQKRNNSPLRR